MNTTATSPHFEFRVFGQNFGRTIESIMAAYPVEDSDEGLYTYILSTTNQVYNVKIRNDQLDMRVLLRQYRGLERWGPYLQLPFPLTSAFLHEFLFAWLEVEPPRLSRSRYTVHQFLQELVVPNHHLCAVQIYKRRRRYTVKGCSVEVASLCIDDQYQIDTVAVEATAAELVLRTMELLGLEAAENTNYIAGIRQLLGSETLPKRMAAVGKGSVVRLNEPELVLVR